MLDYKDYYLLNFIAKTKHVLSVEDLAKLLGVSRRSIYYSINKINYHLEQLHLQPLSNHRDTGIHLSSSTKDFLLTEMHTELASTYAFKKDERIALMVLYIVTRSHTIGIHDFEYLFTVSRNTVINDVKSLRSMLNTFFLSLQYDQNSYHILGEPLRLRSVILYLLSSYHYLLKIVDLELYDEYDFTSFSHLIKLIETELGVTYVNETKDILAKMLSIIKKHHIPPISLRPLDMQDIKRNPEYHSVERIFHQYVDDNELIYITLQLMGLRVHVHHDLDFKDDQLIHDIVKLIIQTFKDYLLIDFVDETTLYDSLYLHFKSGVVRYKYGILYDNDLKDDILEQYQPLYRISKLACKKVEQLISAPISDDDIAYVTMHIGAHLKREQQHFKIHKLLLVCLNGVATSKMLRVELEMVSNHIDIIDAVSIDEVESLANEVDYIISTIPLEQKALEHKIIFVNPVLTQQEKDYLASLFGHNSIPLQYEKFKSSLEQSLKTHLNQKEVAQTMQTVEKLMHQYLMKGFSKENTVDAMLKDLLKPDHITFLDKVNNYEEALYTSGNILIKKNIITNHYIEKVIDNLKTLGPYIVVAPNVVISHARPEDGAMKLGMSMLILKEPVNFSEDKDRFARIIITLSAPDPNSHLTALSQLSALLMEQLDSLLQVSTKEDVLSLIHTYSNTQ
jgi:mannitol operon transcriptional antiterminator